MAAFRSMANRLVSIPLNVNRYQRKREYIIELGRINGYASTAISNIIKKHERRAHLRSLSSMFDNTNSDETKRIVIPYFPPFTNELASYIATSIFRWLTQMTSCLRNSLGAQKTRSWICSDPGYMKLVARTGATTSMMV